MIGEGSGTPLIYVGNRFLISTSNKPCVVVRGLPFLQKLKPPKTSLFIIFFRCWWHTVVYHLTVNLNFPVISSPV